MTTFAPDSEDPENASCCQIAHGSTAKGSNQRDSTPPLEKDACDDARGDAFTGQWADLPLADLAAKTAAWGFDGLELACWGDHFEIDRALADPGYAKAHRAVLEQYGLGCWALGAHLVGQAVCDPIDDRHRRILPFDVWGDGDPEGVRQRAAERMKDTARAAAQFGVNVVTGFTGSPIWHLLYSFPPNDFEAIERGYQEFAERWGPIVDVFDAEGVRFDWKFTRRRSRTTSSPPRRRSPRSAVVPASGSTSIRVTSPTSSSTRRRSLQSSPTASTTSTSKTPSGTSTVASHSGRRTSTSDNLNEGGTSSHPATATSTSRSCSGP